MLPWRLQACVVDEQSDTESSAEVEASARAARPPPRARAAAGVAAAAAAAAAVSDTEEAAADAGEPSSPSFVEVARGRRKSAPAAVVAPGKAKAPKLAGGLVRLLQGVPKFTKGNVEKAVNSFIPKDGGSQRLEEVYAFFFGTKAAVPKSRATAIEAVINQIMADWDNIITQDA